MDDIDWRQEIPHDPEVRGRWLTALRDSITKQFTLEELEQYLITRRKRHRMGSSI